MTVIQLAEHRPPPRTAITPVALVRLGYSRPVTSQATSLDGVWFYEWLMGFPGAPWEVRHNPTGLTEWFDTLDEALVWTADPATLDHLRRCARTQLDGEFVLQSERDRGRRALMLLADPPTLLPHTTDPDQVEAMCVCGGFLAYGPGRILTHVDTCAEELHTPGQPCPDDRNTHTVCDAAAAAVCGHEHCLAPNQHHARPCLMARELCCGCCYGDPR